MSEPIEVAARVNCALIADAADALHRLRERSGMKQVDLINRALQVYDFVDSELRAGNTLIVRDPDGRDQAVKIL